MKRIFSCLLCLMLLLSATAFAEEANTTLEGLVTELVEGGFIMEDQTIGSVLLNVDDTTVLDGILLEQDIEVGQYVFVNYNGILTKSLPPQAHADKVSCYVLTGTVAEFLENGFLLTGNEATGEVIVHLNELTTPVNLNVPITVYFDGIMALSMPGQVNAHHVVVPEVTGTISDKDEAGFTLTDENNVAYRVEMNEDTLISQFTPVLAEMPINGESDTAVIMDDMAVLADAVATDEATLPTDGSPSTEATLEPAENDSVLNDDMPIITFENGDLVTIFYNGMMTKSIPAQITALEVMVLQ